MELPGAGDGVLQMFAYDAYGQLIQVPDADFRVLSRLYGTLTNQLYSGERTETMNGSPWGRPVQYLRARFYDPATGRFPTLDPFAGNPSDPLSLHKYLYTHANPVMGIDPSGRVTIVEFAVGTGIASGLAALFGGAAGALSGGAKGALGGAVGAAISQFSSLWLTTGIFLIPGLQAISAPVGYGIGTMLGSMWNILIVNGEQALSTPEGIFQIGFSAMVGATVGYVFQGAGVSVAATLGKNLLKVPPVKENIRNAALHIGVHERWMTKVSLAISEHPSIFTNAVRHWISREIPTSGHIFTLLRGAISFGNNPIFTNESASAISSWIIDFIEVYRKIKKDIDDIYSIP